MRTEDHRPASVAFLHGFTGSPSSWDRVLERLAEGPARDLPSDRPALLGHGAAEPTAGEITACDFAAEVDRLAVRLARRLPTPIHLVGYSMGGRLALGLLVAHPRLLASATLIGASPGLRDAGQRLERRALDEERARRLELEGVDRFVDTWRALPLFATQARLPTQIRARHDAIRRAHRPQGLAQALRVLGTGSMPDLWPRLGGIGVPVDLVIGAEDRRYREIAVEMAAALPEATVRIVPGCGHDIVLENPGAIADLVAARIRGGRA